MHPPPAARNWGGELGNETGTVYGFPGYGPAPGIHPTAPALLIWLRLALCANVVRRALKVAVIVAPVLVFINHGDVILSGTLTGTHVIKMAATFCVPYLVSTFSSVAAMRRVGIDDPSQIC